MALYVNPVLSNRDYGIARIGGPGLANCMFFAARAAVLAKKLNARLMRPTWERFGIGQWIRKERDKRFYMGLFTKKEGISGFRKALLLATCRKMSEEEANRSKQGVVMVSGLRGYFSDLWADAGYVREYFQRNILPEAICKVPQELHHAVAVHVRLGDYPARCRTDMRWYVDAIHTVLHAWDEMGKSQRLSIKVFSDGSDDELADLLAIPGVERAEYGNALADMIAISRCRFLIGSDSTFSGWGAFLGNVHCLFAHLHYGRPLFDSDKVLVTNDIGESSAWIRSALTKSY